MRLLARKRDGSIHDRDDVLQTPGQRICGLELSTREDVAERISTTEWNVHAVSERKTILQILRNPIGIGGLQVWASTSTTTSTTSISSNSSQSEEVLGVGCCVVVIGE